MFDRERREFDALRERLQRLVDALSAAPLPESDVDAWFRILIQLRTIQGNASNDLSFVACVLARDYLCQHCDIAPFDVAEKPQNAAGIDIDVRTREGARVIAEVKTTVPYAPNDFGAAQASSIKKDLDKLRRADADRKFFFLTDARAHAVMHRKFAHVVPELELVLLAPRSI